MNAPDRAPDEARARHAGEVRKRRNLEAACALDFLVYGDDEKRGPHAERCVHASAGLDPCSRYYDPLPYPEAAPEPGLYEGTGIGALYGVPGGEHLLGQMAGWNLNPRSTR